MRILYQISVYVYFAGILIASLFHSKASLWIKGRRNWCRRLNNALKENRKPVVWIHCSSLGEFEQGRPIIEALRRYAGNNVFILLSFYSPSGYEVRKNYALANLVTYLPLDTPRNAKRWMEAVNPTVALFVKYEFWFNIIQAAHKHQTRIFLVSAVFRPGQLFFKSYGTWYRNILRCFTRIFTQDKASAELLQTFGIENVTVSGDTRFDRVIQVASEEKIIPEAAAFADGHLVMVAGSTWESDEMLLIRYLKETEYPLKMILVPHEIHTTHMARLRKLISVPYTFFSDSSVDETTRKKARIMVVDTIGLLNTLYRYGAIAYVGGGFGKGIHNILEAAVYGMPVFFGPNHEKALEALDMKAIGCGIAVASYSEFKQQMDQLIVNTKWREELSVASALYVRGKTGATRTILHYITDILGPVISKTTT